MSDQNNTGSSLKERAARARNASAGEEATPSGGSSLKDRAARARGKEPASETSGGTSLKDRARNRSSAGGDGGGSSLKDRAGSRRSSRGGSKKKKKNQIPQGIAAIAIALVAVYFFAQGNPILGFMWISGIAFGFILQRARFCFTASMRDPLLTGVTSLSRAVLTAFAITTIGFAAIKYGYFLRGLPIPGQGYVVPISLATLAGGFIFGIGMVIAGGCASGTLMRVGEGFTMQMLSLFFFVIGSLWGAYDFGWWTETFIVKGQSVFLPDYFGWFGAVLLQLVVIGLLYIVADRWEDKKSAH